MTLQIVLSFESNRAFRVRVGPVQLQIADVWHVEMLLRECLDGVSAHSSCFLCHYQQLIYFALRDPFLFPITTKSILPRRCPRYEESHPVIRLPTIHLRIPTSNLAKSMAGRLR